MRPPLVTQLLDARFDDILNEYPLAEQVAPDIRIAIRGGQIALESFLRDELRDSPFDHLRRRYYAIPLYLQHLLWEVSHQYTTHPDNYDRLITEALRFERVTFITLNYDTLLDDRLAIDSPLTSMDDYVSTNRRWSLVKLHGSINWGRAVRHPDPPERHSGILQFPDRVSPQRMQTFAGAFAALGESIAERLDERIELRTGSNLEDIRADWRHMRGTSLGLTAEKAHLFYPAIAVPLGPADEILCPPDHVEHVREHQRYAPEGINVLVIGYSGIDQEVRSLLAWGGRRVATLRVVNGSLDLSFAAVSVLCDALGIEPTEDMAFPGGFTDFAQTHAMATFLRGIPEPA